MNLLALPFYASRASQLHRSRCREYGTQLVAPPNRFLPFLVAKPATGQGLDCVIVFNADTDTIVTTILPASVAVSVYTDGTTDYYIYYGSLVTGLALACGRYFLDVKGYFSEVFTVVDNADSLLKIEWKNSADIAGLPYSLGFMQRLYLDAAVSTPSYPYREEGEKDGSGEFVALSRTLTKTWNFDTRLLPEFLLDVLQSLTLHDAVTIGAHPAVINLKGKVTASTADECASIAQIEFSDPPINASHCAPPLTWLPVDTREYVPKPWLCSIVATSAPFWENTGTVRCVVTATSFTSVAITEMVTANNCPPNTTSQPVSYTLGAGFYVSPASQIDADTQARAYFDATKQAFANNNSICQ